MRNKKVTARWAFMAALVWVSIHSLAAIPDRASETLTICDLDGSKLELSVEEVRALPQVTERECICVGESVGFIDIVDYSGVRLMDVLNKAKNGADAGHYRNNNMYVILRGTDGYQVIASWPELEQSDDGRRALVALDKDGKPLPETEGAFRLVFPGDKYVGRSVKCLETIEIHCVPGVEEKKRD